ncbi:MAG TPA: sigma-54 dependent transcriptional regulator [Polyangiales bacterium]|nr:sigma-54 dependent transcriptional regulator [Polyangiales bacterium]
MSAARILVCDDEAGLREMLEVLLRRAGYEVQATSTCRAALEALRGEARYDLVVSDLALPDGSGMQVLEAAKQRDDALQVIMITAFASTEQAVEAMRLGAYDYVQKPFVNTELLAQIEKALEKRSIVHENRTLRARVKGVFQLGDLVGKAPRMQAVMDVVRRVASGRSSVLITGESGTGKEVVARALHQTGERASQPFVTVNCGALPESLMESELFGHEKGAFTGATARKDGLFRAANGGTLFLDEIGELPTPLQVKLLRVLQERKVRPVGGQQEIEVDVRVVAATNRDVEVSVREGSFRQDLFYRLNVIRIQLPPLRERMEDVPTLAQHFLLKHSALEGKRLSLSPEAMSWIVQQRYPGNVRELENVIERAVALASEPLVVRSDLSDEAAESPAAPPVLPAEGVDLDAQLGALERGMLVQALERTGGNRTNAAKLLRMTLRSLRYRLAKYGLGEESGSSAFDDAEEA